METTAPVETKPEGEEKPKGKRIFQILEDDFNRAVMDAFDNGLIHAAGDCLKLIRGSKTKALADKKIKKYKDAVYSVVLEREKERKENSDKQRAEYEAIKAANQAEAGAE